MTNMPEESNSVSAANYSDKETNNNTKVLVIEDDKFLRELIIRKLNAENFNVVEAIDGEEGLKKAGAEKPDIVLLDIVLPGIDGFEILKRMKADPELSKIPVIMLTNLGQRDDIQRGIDMGAVDYLIKAHFTPSEIIERVKKVMREKYV